jgi:hypothetical protein
MAMVRQRWTDIPVVCSSITLPFLNDYHVGVPPSWSSAECEYCGRYQERPPEGTCRGCGAPLPRPR